MTIYNEQAEYAFQTVLEEAQWDGLRNALLRRPRKLLSYSAVKNILKLGLPHDRGIHEINLDNIVGSVGRFNEFSRTFKPTQSYTRSRWKSVAESYYQKGFHPIRVYKVSHIYFVIDGNHRVSVSRAMNLQTISAQVFEIDTALELNNKDDLGSICRKWHAYQEATGQITNISPVKMQKSSEGSRAASRGALLTLMLGAVLIGTVPIFVRFSEVGPMATGFWRVFLSLPLLLVILNRQNNSLEIGSVISNKKWVFWLLLGGVSFAGDQATFNLAVQRTSVANAALLINMAPIVVTLVVWLFFKEKFSLTFLIGLIVVLSGAIILVGGNANITSESLLGDFFGLLSAFFSAGYTISLAQLRRRLSVPTVMVVVAIVGGLIMFSLASFSGETVLTPTFNGWLPLLGLALVAHIGGQGLITLSVAKLSAAVASIGLLMQPIAAAIMASMFLSESISAEQFVGGAIILAGISITQIGKDLKRHFQARWFTARRQPALAC